MKIVPVEITDEDFDCVCSLAEGMRGEGEAKSIADVLRAALEIGLRNMAKVEGLE